MQLAPFDRRRTAGFALGIGMTLVIALLAKGIASLPFFTIMGQLVIAILLGIAWRSAFGVPQHALEGIQFSNKKLLRLGIILLGMRLNLQDLWQAGPKGLVIAAAAIVVGFAAVYGLSRLFRTGRNLGVLTACGTAICGAAAIIAISAQIKAKNEETAVSAATIALLGTTFTLIYTLLHPLLGLTPYEYGAFVGGTLHEIAHVVAAAAPGGDDALDIAIIVKLTRVALLVPVAILIGFWFSRSDSAAAAESEGSGKSAKLPIPWFIFGFLAMSAFGSLGIVSPAVADGVVTIAYLLMAMAMAGLGLGVDIASFARLGKQTFAAGLVGSIVLVAAGFGLVTVLQLV